MREIVRVTNKNARVEPNGIFSLIPFLPFLALVRRDNNTVCGCGRKTRMITVWAKFRATSGPRLKKNKRSRPMLLAQYHRSWLRLSLALSWIRACFSCFVVRAKKKEEKNNAEKIKKEKKSFLQRDSRAGQPLPHAKKEANGHHELSIPYRSRLGSLHDPPALVDSFHRLACREKCH